MTKQERYEHIIKHFKTTQPIAETELEYHDAFSLLVAVILSAQCTDKRVNMITPDLLKAFPTPEKMADTTSDEIYQYIKSCNFANNKSKHLVGMAKMLVEQFDQKVPDNITDLQKLPGVGRKTANVVVSVIYHQPAMAVDTHVFRVSERLGLTTRAKTPLETEMQLIKHIPKEYIATAHHWLILHGRYTCLARKPKCEICELTQWCKFFAKNNPTL